MFYRFNEIQDSLNTGSLIGKKAESLIEMKKWGLPVPDGGCITTEGFNKFISLNKMKNLLTEIRTSVDKGDDKKIKGMTQEIIKLISQGQMPAEIVSFIEKLADDHPDKHFAIRSSGTKEDMENISFAGLYSSTLNVKSPDRLLTAVKQCWASLFNQRVLNYCINKNITYHDMNLSVILQQMIPAEKSGVIFTVNPVTGNDKEIVVEACFGLGEALVSGKVTPDLYIYNWYKDKKTVQNISDKMISIVPIVNPPFTKTVQNSLELRNQPVLNNNQIDELVTLAKRIQSHFGFPVDIEWAYHDGKFYILQSRPITKINYSDIKNEWTTADFKDGGVSSTVCTPYMWSLYDYVWEITMPSYLKKVCLIDDDQGIKWGDMFFARPYWNAGEVKEGLKRLPGFDERAFDEDLGIQVTYKGDGLVTPTNIKSIWAGIKVLIALKKSFKEQIQFCPTFKEQQKKKLAELDTFDPNQLPAAEFYKFYETFIKEEYFLSESSYFYLIFDNSNVNTMFKDTFNMIKENINLLNLISGLTDLSHMIPNYKLWDIKTVIENDEDACRFWDNTSVEELIRLWRSGENIFHMDKVRYYIEEFKFHSTRELDITVPHYDEDPSFVIESIKNQIGMDKRFDPRELNKKQHQVYLLEREKLLKAVPFYKKRSIKSSLEQLRKFLWWREELRNLSAHYYYHVRRFTLTLARHFKDRDIISEREDIFFLTINDCFSIIHNELSAKDAKKCIEKNKFYYLSFRNFNNPDEIGSRYKMDDTAKHADSKNLKGIACSPGKVTGKVRIIKDIFDANRLRKGDILVTKFTDPGWTPKFGLLAGVVTETGGLLSHAAVISREYGIPAVLAVNNITQILTEGQTVTIDGNSGQIIINS